MRKDSGIQSTDDTVVHEEGKSNAESETDRVTVHRPRQRGVYHHDQPSDDRRDMSGQQDVEAARNASDTLPDVEVVSTPSSSEPATSTSIVIESSHDSTGALMDSQEQSSGSQPGSDTAETIRITITRSHRFATETRFKILKLIEIVILWVYYTIPFGFSLFRYFLVITFQFFILHVWLRITDEGSVPEMRIWSISLI